MANLSWNEIPDRAVEFASKWDGETYERGESQSFWSDFLNIFGVDRLYRIEPFATDADRVAMLFERYQKATQKNELNEE